MPYTETNLLKMWEDATLANNFLFCKIMSSDKELCKELLEALLEIQIDHLEEPSSEKTMMESAVSKTVRFDVYAKNSSQIFDIEMQTSTNWRSNIAKRTRYYQSVIDIDALQAGERYSKLKDSYIIFICLDDPFGKNLPVYRFENMSLTEIDSETQKDKDVVKGKDFVNISNPSDNPSIKTFTLTKLEDKAYKIFFNASACDKIKTNDKVKNFLKILKGEKAGDDFSKKLEDKVNFAKKNLNYRGQFMTFQELLEDEKELVREKALKEGHLAGLEEGMEKGAHEKALENAKNLLKMKLGTIKQIAEATGLSITEVEGCQGPSKS